MELLELGVSVVKYCSQGALASFMLNSDPGFRECLESRAPTYGAKGFRDSEGEGLVLQV